MLNIEKEREAFESTQNTKVLFERIEYLAGINAYMPKYKFANQLIVMQSAERFNFGWSMWQASALRAEEKLKGCVVVPESELTDTFYWPDSEYVVDCPFDYDFELDKGEIQVIEKWQRTKSTKIYFANIYKDEESFEITEFQSLEEAQDAVKENNAYLESEDFFNLAEAARGGNHE